MSMTFDEIEVCLESKELHCDFLALGYKIIEACLSGRTLFTVYHGYGRYKIVWWRWNDDIGWHPKMVNGELKGETK